MPVLLIGLAAGTVSALLFVSLASGSMLSIALFYLSPLPIMLAGIGWSHLAALTAVLVAAGGLGIGVGFWFMLAFLGGVGVPAFILSYLAMLARTSEGGDLEWYPIGRIVLWAACLASLMSALTIPVFGFDVDAYRAGLRSVFEHVLRIQMGTPDGQPLRLPNSNDASRALTVLTYVMPPLAAILSMLTQLVNLYLAGRIARVSNRLTRPWPDISGITFPFSTPLFLLAVVVLSFLHSLVGLTAGVLAACFFTAYALMGLAVVHAVTRANAMRGLILSVMWGLVIVLGWPIAFLALLGLADGLLNFRSRFGPPNSNLPTNPE